jgi:hypothetical protein
MIYFFKNVWSQVIECLKISKSFVQLLVYCLTINLRKIKNKNKIKPLDGWNIQIKYDYNKSCPYMPSDFTRL